MILNDEQLVYLRYYEKISRVPIGEVVREIIEDWLDALTQSMLAGSKKSAAYRPP